MVYVYDGSYHGLLTVIFEIYASKKLPSMIVKERNFAPSIFNEINNVVTDDLRSRRVFTGLAKKVSPVGLTNLWKSWLSEIPDMEMHIYRYIDYALHSSRNVELNYANDAVLKIKQTVKMINREVHRMHAFVRFQKTVDELYVSTIKPDFDVMPLIWQHFKKRYADQQWLIYDIARDYGMLYNLSDCKMVVLQNPEFQANKKIKRKVVSTEDDEYQKLWQTYFKSTTIAERKNIKLHLKHVPRRYWQYLPEKLTA